MSDNFFSRWSRRKQGLETHDAPQAERDTPPATATATVTTTANAAVSAAVPSQRRADQPQQPSTAARSATGAVAPPADGPQPAMPTMEDVQGLTPTSDFQTFMRRGVPGEVRNAAMKKLFTDPHFNVMDGLDIYIGDYNTPDPLPAGMLEKMVGAELLNLFPKKAQIDPPQTAVTDVQENPEQSPDAPEGSPLVAQSPPSPMTQALQATPALQASEPIEHDHPDLQLQPNHAPASPSPGQSTG